MSRGDGGIDHHHATLGAKLEAPGLDNALGSGLRPSLPEPTFTRLEHFAQSSSVLRHREPT